MEAPRGRPVSGRVWKGKRTRFSSVKKSEGQRRSLAEKKRLREELRRIREASKEALERNAAEREAKRQRRRDNLRREREKAERSEVVQVISDPAKIKRMKRRQLRAVAKRDTGKIKRADAASR